MERRYMQPDAASTQYVTIEECKYCELCAISDEREKTYHYTAHTDKRMRKYLIGFCVTCNCRLYRWK